MALGTAICWVAWGMVLVNIDPFTADTVAFVIFYASLYFALVGTISLISTPLRQIISRGALPTYRYVERGFRDGAVLSFLLVVMLFLQIKGWLSPLTATTFLLAAAFIIAFRYTAQPKPTISIDSEEDSTV